MRKNVYRSLLRENLQPCVLRNKIVDDEISTKCFTDQPVDETEHLPKVYRLRGYYGCEYISSQFRADVNVTFGRVVLCGNVFFTLIYNILSEIDFIIPTSKWSEYVWNHVSVRGDGHNHEIVSLKDLGHGQDDENSRNNSDSALEYGIIPNLIEPDDDNDLDGNGDVINIA